MRALCRQIPKVGAECLNWARSDLCGGRPAMDVPTANNMDGVPVIQKATISLHFSLSSNNPSMTFFFRSSTA